MFSNIMAKFYDRHINQLGDGAVLDISDTLEWFASTKNCSSVCLAPVLMGSALNSSYKPPSLRLLYWDVTDSGLRERFDATRRMPTKAQQNERLVVRTAN